jgi:hypothetical protein
MMSAFGEFKSYWKGGDFPVWRPKDETIELVDFAIKMYFFAILIILEFYSCFQLQSQC